MMNKRFLASVLSAAMVLGTVSAPAFAVGTDEDSQNADVIVTGELLGAGEGTGIDWTASEITISTAAEFKEFADKVNADVDPMDFSGKTITLAADITLTGDWTPIGNGVETPFKGTFNGNGHTVSGLNVNKSDSGSESPAGLFGLVIGGTVKDLTVEGAVSGQYYCGAIAGNTFNSTISGCTNKAVVTGKGYSAGIAAVAHNSVISGNTNDGSVTNIADPKGLESVGGIVGEARWGSVVADNTNNAVIDNTKGHSGCGGIVGWVRYLWDKTVTTQPESSERVKITGNTNNGDVLTNPENGYAGGIVGQIYSGADVIGNTNTGAVTGKDCGGAVGNIYAESTSSTNLGTDNIGVTVVNNTSAIEGLNSVGNAITQGQGPEIKIDVIEKAVAKIGEKYYGSITQALNDVEKGGTVTVINGTDEAITMPLKDLTLKGAEGTMPILTGGIKFALGTIPSNLDITIEGLHFDKNGIEIISWGKTEELDKAEKLTITNNKFTNVVDEERGANIYAIHINTATGIRGLTIADNVFEDNVTGAVYTTVSGETVITGNKIINSGYNGINVNANGTYSDPATSVIISNNIFENWGTVRIDPKTGNPEGRAMRLSNFADGTKLDLTGNVFTCKNAPEEYIKITGVEEGANVDINKCYWGGGEPTLGEGKGANILIDGIAYAPVTYYKDAEMTQIASTSNVVAQVGENYYSDLQAAIDAAEPGATVELLKDVTIDGASERIQIKKSIILDGGEGKHSITCTAADANRAIMLEGQDLTVAIKNLKIEGFDGQESINDIRGISVFNCDNINLTVENVEATAKNMALVLVSGDNMKVDVKNSKLTSQFYTINVNFSVKNATVNVTDNTVVNGWAALNIWGYGNTINVNGSTLNGYNDKSYDPNGWNGFGVVVLAGNSEYKSENCKVVLDNSTINADTKVNENGEGNIQKAILFNSGSVNDSVEIKGNTTINCKRGELTLFMVNSGTGNKAAVTGGKSNVDFDAEALPAGYTTYLSNGYYHVVNDFTMEATADKAEVKAGEEVKVTVAATGASYTNADWKLRYDPTKLTLVKSELIEGAAEVNAEDYTLAGKIGNVGASTGDEIATGTVLATYTFKAVAQTTSPVPTTVEVIDAHVNTYDMAIQLTNVPAKTTKNAETEIVIDADASITGTLATNTVTYDGKAHMANPFIPSDAYTGAVVTYSTEENGTYSTVLPSFTAVGTYDVWYKAELAGYSTKNVKAEGAVVIEPKEVTAGVEVAAGAVYPEVVIRPTITGVEDRTFTGKVTVVIDGQSFTFNAADFTFDGNSMAILNADKAQTVSLSKGGVFSVTAYYEAGTADNYKGNADGNTSEINVDLAFADEATTDALKAAITSEFVYDGTAHGVEIGTLPSSWSVKSVTAIGGAENPSVTNVADGSVFVQVVFTDEAGRYNNVTVNTVLAITPAEAVITVEKASKAFGAADNSSDWTYTTSGLLNNNDLGTITVVRAELGEDRGTYAMTAIYTANTNYNVTVVNGKLEIGAPKYLVEVVDNSKIHGGDVKSDYVAGYKLILVYTDADRSYFTYGAKTLFDVTERGYKYVDDEGNTDDTNYRHVFGIVVKADGNASAADYRNRINYTTDPEAQPERIVYDMDINLDGLYSVNDYSAANGVYNALYEEVYAKNMLKADADGNKMVDTVDVEAVKAKADR